jgi:acetyl-CoA C-acetyltransferase
VPKLARRAIGWPLDKPISVFGGLTFGGGPVGNYMSHAIAAMAQALRTSGGHGLLFGNGGLATTSHAIVVSRDPGIAVKRAPSATYDDTNRTRVELLETYEGEARIETHTVFYTREGAPRAGVIVARTPGGERVLARVEANETDLIALLTSGESEPVGARGIAKLDDDGLIRWR